MDRSCTIEWVNWTLTMGKYDDIQLSASLTQFHLGCCSSPLSSTNFSHMTIRRWFRCWNLESIKFEDLNSWLRYFFYNIWAKNSYAMAIAGKGNCFISCLKGWWKCRSWRPSQKVIHQVDEFAQFLDN